MIYDLNSLVGEVGGSLGLFLGLSLVTVYQQILEMGRLLMRKGGMRLCRMHEEEKTISPKKHREDIMNRY